MGEVRGERGWVRSGETNCSIRHFCNGSILVDFLLLRLWISDRQRSSGCWASFLPLGMQDLPGERDAVRIVMRVKVLLKRGERSKFTRSRVSRPKQEITCPEIESRISFRGSIERQSMNEHKIGLSIHFEDANKRYNHV